MEPLHSDDPAHMGPYRLLSRLGAGGMGVVYLARSTGGRTVAVKVVRPELAEDADFRQRFRHEVEVARAVSGRFTAPVVDADTEAAVPWLATQYVTGPSLTDVVDQHGAQPERTVRALGAGLAAALGEIHAAQLVHRDLKPSNVLLAADAPRVIDFGIARAVDGERLTRTGVVVGSPGFMSPEQATAQQIGPASDVFSLGAVLAFAATGRSAFGDAAPAAMLYHVVHTEPDLTGVPESLRRLLAACLAKDPAARPAPATLIAELQPGGLDAAFTDWLPSAVASTIANRASDLLDLETPAHGVPPPAPSQPAVHTGEFGPPPPSPYRAPTEVDAGSAPNTPVPPSPSSSRRRFLGIAAGALGVAAVGGGAAWLLTREDSGATADGDSSNAAKPADKKPDFTTPPPGVAPQPLWTADLSSGDLHPGAPILALGNLVYVAGDPVRAFDVRTGKQVWSRKELANPEGGNGFVHADGVLYYGSGDFDGALVGLNAKTGKETWRARLGGNLDADKPLATDGKLLYMIADIDTGDIGGGRQNAICAMDLKTRKKVWDEQRDKGTGIGDGLEVTLAPGYLVYTDSRGSVTVRDTDTGRQLWTDRPTGKDSSVVPVIVDDLLLIEGDKLLALNIKTGKEVWSLEPGDGKGFKAPTLHDGTLYVFDHRRGFWAVNPKTGKKLWRQPAQKRLRSGERTVKHGNTIYVGAYFGEGITALDATTGKERWAHAATDDETDPWNVALTGNRLLAQTGDKLYAFPAV